jgi:ERCC4-related helicase
MQRIGRIIRKRPNHIADIHILVFKNTIDEMWVNDILSEYKDLITYINN